jgi:predicted MFS family arabinose efflux permease
VSLVAIYAAAFALGALETAFSAASQACLPSLVAVDELPRANGYLFAAQATGEQFAGPALGGLLFAAAAALPFVLDGVSFLASAALLCLALPRRRRRASAAPPRESFGTDLASGLRWFTTHPVLRLLALVVASLAFCQSMVLAILVLYCLRVLHLGHAGFGLFLALAAVGNVVGGLLAGRITARLGTGRVVFAAALLAAAAYIVVGMTSALGIALLALAAEAVAVAVGNVATLSLRQSLIPSELLGRVGNAFRMCIFGVIPLGALAGGLIAHSVGLHAVFIVAGGLQLVVIAMVGPRLARRLAGLTPPPEDVIDLDVVSAVAGLMNMEPELLSAGHGGPGGA